MTRGLVVHVEDTFATGLDWLGVALPEGIYGKPVWAIYQKPPKGTPTTAPVDKPVAKPAAATAMWNGHFAYWPASGREGQVKRAIGSRQ
jgi:hypothetical protein